MINIVGVGSWDKGVAGSVVEIAGREGGYDLEATACTSPAGSCAAWAWRIVLSSLNSV